MARAGVRRAGPVAEQVLHRDALLGSAEGGVGHVDTSRIPSAVVQDWALGANFSTVPFDTLGSRFWRGSLTVGVGPHFVRFNTLHQNQAGVGLWLRYYLTGLTYGRMVPWIDASVTPTGGDLRIRHLSGGFMFVLQGGLGASYFVTDRTAVYAGYRLRHVSNAYTHGRDEGVNSHGLVVGVSYFLR